MMTIEIPGKCVPKARPRMTRSGHAYTPKTTTDYEQLVKDSYRLREGNDSFYEQGTPIYAEITIYEQIPKSFSNKKRIQALKGEIAPTKRPDLDNCAKSVLDALNGLAYHDDSQVVWLTIQKVWGVTGRTKVTLMSAEEYK